MNLAPSANFYKSLLLSTILTVGILLSAQSVSAATEFIAIVDPDQGAGYDFDSLYDWEAAIQSDLASSATMVFSYDGDTASGTIPALSTVVGFSSGATASSTWVTATSASAQILLTNISGTFQSGERVYIQSQASTTNFVDLTTAGDSAIAVAKCRSTGGSADTSMFEISGWTTDSDNYIKVWTDPDDPYSRHNGEWSENQYHMYIDGDDAIHISQDGKVIVDGLQIWIHATGWQNLGIFVKSTYNTEASEVYLSNNIIRGTNNGSQNYHSGIESYNNLVASYIWNNIVYGFNSGGFGNYCIWTRFDESYVYNNTVYGCDTGFDSSNQANLYINNISNNCSNYDYFGSFSASSSNNISSDWTAPGTNSQTTTTVQFLDAANHDFHLHQSDTAARDQGTSSLEIPLLGGVPGGRGGLAYDIDGTARGAAFDIGADEVPVEFVSTICETAGSGGDCNEMDYHSLVDWNTNVHVSWDLDLGATSTRVFGGYISGTLDRQDVLDVYSGGADTGIDVVMGASTTDQVLVGEISGTTTPLIVASGTQFRLSGGTANMWTVMGIGDDLGASPKLVVKIDGNWSNEDEMTSVIIGHYTDEDQDNYIKIYTTDIARHQGKWNDTKYRARFMSGGLRTGSSYVEIYGLQIRSSSNNNALNYQNQTSGNPEMGGVIAHNIIKQDLDINGGYGGISIWGDGGDVYLYDNIIYDFNDGLGVGLNDAPNRKIYFFNNVIHNCSGSYWNMGAMYSEDGAVIAINNIISSSSNAYDGDFDPQSSNNITDGSDSIGVGSNNLTNVSLSFVSTASGTENFHLTEDNPQLINAGYDIAASSTFDLVKNLNTHTDIDGAARDPDGLGWDIGADEYPAKQYRSVGNDSSDLSNGGTVTISSTTRTATFSLGQPNNIGVGDVIQFGGAGYYDLAFISGRTSSTTYSVQAYDTKAPTATTSASFAIYRAHLLINDWEDQLESHVNGTIDNAVSNNVLVNQDLVASNTIMMVSAYASTPGDTSWFYIQDWTTGKQNYLKIYTPFNANEVGQSQRHKGKWDSTKYYLSTSNANSIVINEEYVRIEGLQIKTTTSGTFDSGLGVDLPDGYYSGEIYLSNNLIQGQMSGSANNNFGVALSSINNADVELYLFNNVIYGFNNGASYTDLSGLYVSIGWNTYVFNNTFVDNYRAINDFGLSIDVKNNIAQNCLGQCYVVDNLTSFSGNNISSDWTAPGTDSLTTTTVTFWDEANQDYHLAPSSPGIDAGTSSPLSLTGEGRGEGVAYDIDGHLRRTWDIGADEASHEFVSTVMETGGDFDSLYDWEAANQVDLTADDTAVFTISNLTGLIPNGSSLTGQSSGATASTTVVSTSSNQILLYNITGTFESGEQVQLNASNHVTLANAGNTANAAAKIDGAWSSAESDNTISVSGWATDKYNRIKIYTTRSARHQGKWDESKYRRIKSGSDAALYIAENHVDISGLQVEYNGSSDYHGGIYVDPTDGTMEDINLSYNIVKGVSESGAFNAGITLSFGNNQDISIYNNIVYGFNDVTDCGIRIDDPVNAENIYVFNNTVYDNTTGIYVSRSGHAINNISVENGTDFYTAVEFSNISGYNISSDSTAPGTNSKTNTTVTFVDPTNHDFHLALTDTAARNQGTSSLEIPLLGGVPGGRGGVAYDIDGTHRGASWDIGADEAATEFVSSIMQTSGDYHSLSAWEDAVESNLVASNTLVYSGSLTGTLSENDYVTLYRFGTSQNIAGTVVATTTSQILIDNIKASSTVSFNAQSGDQWRVDASNYWTVTGSGDALGNSPIAIAKIDGAWSATDTTSVYIEDWDTGPGNYIRIYTTETARHSGAWNYEKYRLDQSGSDYALNSLESNLIVDGLQVGYSGSWVWGEAIRSRTTSNITISNNIIRNSGIEGYHLIDLNGGGGDSFIYNNIIYGASFSTNNGTAILAENDIGYYTFVYNNTIYDCYYGIRNSNDIIAKNNIIASTTNPFEGTFAAGTDYNATDNSDTPGVGGNNRTNQTFTFISTSTENFHLASSDEGAKNAGVNLSNDVWIPASAGMTGGSAGMTEGEGIIYDIDGDSRSLTQPWDIGADEISDVQADSPARISGDTADTDSLTDGLVGHWDFNTGFGDTVIDRSGNGNDGTWAGSGARWTAEGRFGSGGEFNNTNDEVVLDNLDDLDMSQENSLTISAWVKPENTTSDGAIISRGGVYTANGNFSYYLAKYNIDNTRWQAQISDGVNEVQIITSTGMVDALEWQHLTLTWDGTNLHLYKNGVQIESRQNSSFTGIWNGDETADRETSIGSDGRAEDDYWDGSLDEVRLYNRALSQREVNLLYNRGRAAVEWDFRNNLQDTGTLCAVNSSDCKDLSFSSGNPVYSMGYLNKGISSLESKDAKYAYLANDSYFDVSSTSDFSITATIKTTDTSNAAILAKKSNTAAGSAGWIAGLDLGVGGDGVPVIMISDGVDQYVIIGESSIADDKWYTIVYIIDEDSTANSQIYVDGSEFTGSRIGTLNVVEDLTVSNQIRIGTDSTGNNALTGSIDRVAFYPYALTRADVLRESVGGSSARIGNDPSQTTTGQAYDPFGGAAPVAWWKLDEMSGNTAYDYASSSLNGTWYGTGTSTWHMNGKIGMGGQFNGVDDRVYVGSPSALNLDDDISVFTWVYFNDVSGSNNGDSIVGQAASNGVAGQIEFKIGGTNGIRDPGLLYVGWNDNGIDVSNSTLSTGQWYYVGYVRTGSTGDWTSRIYINGVLDAEQTSIATNPGSQLPFGIGRLGDYEGYILDGIIDDVKIYNYARTPAQIAWDYNGGKPVGHWKFDEASSGSADGATIIDSSGNGNSGTGDDGGNNSGLSWTSGKWGNAVDFDGVDDFVSVSGLMGSSQNITISVWANLDSIDSGGADLFSIGDYVILRLGDGSGINNTGSLYNTASWWNTPFSGNFIGAGWNHFVYTIDDASKIQKIYVNGNLSASTSWNRTVEYSGEGSNTFIGQHGNGSSAYSFDGKIDDVRIYNYALTDELVKEIYNGGTSVRFGN